MRSIAFSLIAAFALAAPARAEDTAASRYRVNVDLTDAIRGLGGDGSSYDASVQLLSGLGVAAVPALAEALRREPEKVRIGIVEVLDQIGEPECVPLLIEAGKDASLDVRVDALTALGSLGDERARTLVEKSLDDGNEAVRRAAAAACDTVCRSDAAIHRLAVMAVRDRPLDALFAARRSFAALIGSDDVEAAKAAEKAMTEVVRPAFDKSTERQERVRAALLLADAGDARAISWLRESLSAETEPALRLQVIGTLGTAGDASAVPVLVDQAKDAARRPVVCRALEQLATRNVAGAAAAAAACKAALPPRKS